MTADSTSEPSASIALSAAYVDDIPVVWASPTPRSTPLELVLWLPGLTGTKERLEPYLRDLAAAGFLALSFDPWQHGARGSESPRDLGARVFGSFRHAMWPIIGQTVLDARRVIDWALANLDVSTHIRAGGISMGGDIAVALAGADARVQTVAAMIATPDWLRPGMQDLSRPGALLPQGEADSYAQFFYDQFNPLTHVPSYARCPAITFECGAQDTHVPPDGALRFQAALQTIYQVQPERLRVNLHPGVGHTSAAPVLWQSCLEWFARW